jgi:hypothetical protein
MIELGEERSIKDILTTLERNRRKRDAKKNASAQTRREPKIAASNGEGNTPPVVQKLRCDSGKCMTCSTCVTNAKWEKVFNEKFADPDYYKAGLPTRIGSTLSRLP